MMRFLRNTTTVLRRKPAFVLAVLDDFEDGTLDGWTVQAGSPSIQSGNVGTSDNVFAILHRTAESFAADQYAEVELAAGFDPDIYDIGVHVRHRTSDEARYNPIYGAGAFFDTEASNAARWSIKFDGAAETLDMVAKDRQHVRPDAEDANPGAWGVTGAATTWEAIDDPAQDFTFGLANEVAPDDADYIESPNNPSGDIIRFGTVFLANRTGGTGADPGVDKSHRLIIRHQKNGAGGRTIDLTWRVKKGDGTVIQSGTIADISDAWTTTRVFLTAANVATISDYTDLFLEIEANVSGTGAGRTARVSYIEIDVPDILPVAGDVIRAEVTGQDPNIVVTGKKNGVTLLTVTPATAQAIAGGAPGLIIEPDNQTGFDPFGALWRGGDL